MRTTLLALVVAVALAGCTSNNGGTTTTPATNTTVPTSGANGAAVEVKKASFDFTTLGTPAGGPSSVTFDVPAGHATLNLTVKFSSASPAPVGVASGISVKAAGLTCALPDGPGQGTFNCLQTGPAKAGPGKIEASGNGPVVASVTLTAQ